LIAATASPSSWTIKPLLVEPLPIAMSPELGAAIAVKGFGVLHELEFQPE
jgi:hypothetical protein